MENLYVNRIIGLLRKNTDKREWCHFSSAISLLEENINEIDRYYLQFNLNAISILQDDIYKID